MIVVHHLEKSRSRRVLWLLEELGLEYEIVSYARDPATLRAPRELRAVHPLGKSPVLEEDGQVFAESAAILEELLDRHDPAQRFRPAAGTAEHRRYRYYVHYAEGSLMPVLLLALVFARMPKAPMPFFARPVARGIAAGAREKIIVPQLALHLDFLESELASRDWFAGDAFSAADIQMSFPLEAARARGGLEGHTRLSAWLARIDARPARARAKARGGDEEDLPS